MHPNEKLLSDFFSAIKNKDYKALYPFYASGAVFNDPLYNNLAGEEIKAMWEKFFIDCKDLQVDLLELKADDTNAKAKWKASYVYRATDNAVEKEVSSSFTLTNGKISKHLDEYNFRNWAGQALGLMGSLLGWSGFVENQVRENARKNLDAFMSDEI